MTLYYLGNARRQYREEETRCQKGLKLFFLIIFAAPAIPMMTVVYIGYVALVFATKCVKPGYIDDTDGNNISTAGSLKLIEAVGEANLQAVLGSFTSPLTIIIKPEFISFLLQLLFFSFNEKLISFD